MMHSTNIFDDISNFFNRLFNCLSLPIEDDAHEIIELPAECVNPIPMESQCTIANEESFFDQIAPTDLSEVAGSVIENHDAVSETQSINALSGNPVFKFSESQHSFDDEPMESFSDIETDSWENISEPGMNESEYHTAPRP